jgi:hypothetical protein
MAGRVRSRVHHRARCEASAPARSAGGDAVCGEDARGTVLLQRKRLHRWQGKEAGGGGTEGVDLLSSVLRQRTAAAAYRYTRIAQYVRQVQSTTALILLFSRSPTLSSHTAAVFCCLELSPRARISSSVQAAPVTHSSFASPSTCSTPSARLML